MWPGSEKRPKGQDEKIEDEKTANRIHFNIQCWIMTTVLMSFGWGKMPKFITPMRFIRMFGCFFYSSMTLGRFDRMPIQD